MAITGRGRYRNNLGWLNPRKKPLANISVLNKQVRWGDIDTSGDLIWKDWFFEAGGGGTNYELNLNDSVTTSDSIVKSAGLSKSDSVTTSDGVVKSVVLNLSDLAATLDTLFAQSAFILILGQDDVVTITDGVVKNIGVEKSDSITLTDEFDYVRGLSASMEDSVTVTDDIALLTEMQLEDEATTDDYLFNDIFTVQEDEVFVSDDIIIEPDSAGGGSGGGSWGDTSDYIKDEQKRIREQQESNEKTVIEILKFWAKELQ